MSSPSSETSSDDFKLNWVIFYFDESQRGWTDRQLLGKMLHDLENPLAITWTPYNPGIDEPFQYSLLVISIGDTLAELLESAREILVEYIRINGTDHAPFKREMLFPPLK